jgi:hypothetical protein
MEHIVPPRKLTNVPFIFKGESMRVLLPILFTTIALCSSTPIANAAPTVSIGGGATTIQFFRAFLSTVTTAGVRVSKVEESTTNRNTIICPVIEGVLDREDARGEIEHSGGARFTGNRTIVRLMNFSVDTGAATPVITADVVLNNSFVSRQPVFNAVLPDLTLPLPSGRRSLTIRPIALTLTTEAADVLNDAFTTSAFVGGSSVGRASTIVIFGRSNLIRQ